MSDGADRTEDASRILVWGTPRTTGRGGHMKIASIRTQSVSGRNSRRAMNAEREIGQPVIGHLKRRIDTETAGGIFSRKWALFMSDGTDSTTFGSNTPESHADRPPELEYSERLITDKRQGEGGTERSCFSHIQLEMAVSQLQRDVEDCRAERELARNQTPAVTLRP